MMPSPSPLCCRAEAFRTFEQALPVLETSQGLLQAAVAVSMHALPEIGPDLVEDEIRRLAAQVRAGVRTNQPNALFARLHQTLFDDEGFDGAVDDYYNPRHSYLPCTLASKRGLPIVLALIYKLVAERLGLEVEGIGAPGHFLVRVTMDGHPTLIDPFHSGRLLTRDEALRRVEQITGSPAPDCVDVLQPVTHRQWIQRMLNNLQVVFAGRGCSTNLAAMRELAVLL